MENKNIYVTKPYLPPLEEFSQYLEQIWENGQLTNNGPFHQKLEKELCEYLGVENISLFSNGTLALITAIQALEISGEVITTPFSFVATTHSLWWNNIKPIFIDIDPITLNLDPDKIEKAITPATTAIMPVHVYGTPCDTDKIKRIADKYNLKVIYDAAHAFGVTQNGISVLNQGDLSILSFHATKVFNTFEGGAIVCKDKQMKQHIDDLKNFGFRDETTVVEPGINAKMNELQAAMGLLQLRYVDDNIIKRKTIADKYRTELGNISGISLLDEFEGIKHNYSYFPVFIDENSYGRSRDELYEELKRNNIFGRRYFYPLISMFSPYNKLSSAAPELLPCAVQASNEVICLPIYPDLLNESVLKIIKIIKQ